MRYFRRVQWSGCPSYDSAKVSVLKSWIEWITGSCLWVHFEGSALLVCSAEEASYTATALRREETSQFYSSVWGWIVHAVENLHFWVYDWWSAGKPSNVCRWSSHRYPKWWWTTATISNIYTEYGWGHDIQYSATKSLIWVQTDRQLFLRDLEEVNILENL